MLQQIKANFPVVENATLVLFFFSFMSVVVCHKKFEKSLKYHKEQEYTTLLIPHILLPNLMSGFAVYLFTRTM